MRKDSNLLLANHSKDERSKQQLQGADPADAETQTGEQLDELLRQEWLRRDVTDIRAGREEKKDWLPFICPHYTANGMDTRGTRNMLLQWVYRGYLLQMTVFVK